MTTAASRRLRSTVTRLPHGESSGFVGRATAAMTGAGEGTAEAECPICLAPLQRSEAGFTCSHCQSRLHWRCCEAWWQREQQQRSVVSSARRPDVCVCPVCAHPERRLPYSTCHCGKSLIARGEHNAPVAASRSCGQVCGGGACGHGGCTRECHSGPCDPCPGTVTVSCVCGRQKTALRCGEYQAGVRSGRAPWLRCRHPCNALLPCGHRCRRVCHARQPLDDENDIAEACLPCEETVTATCVEHGKRWALRCGSIDDPQRFWCGRDLQRRCRCGAALVARHCTDLADSGDQPATAPPPPFCGRICDRRLSCGRHRCVRQCCDDALHACPEVCGKPRRLGTPDACAHVCAVRCHSGACPPCQWQSSEPLSCACGKTRIPPPVHCGTPLPHCPEPCTRPRACPHPCSLGRCHPGSCPRCPVLVVRECLGGHERRWVACGAKLFACYRPCGRLLSCGRHRCAQPCHALESGHCGEAHSCDREEVAGEQHQPEEEEKQRQTAEKTDSGAGVVGEITAGDAESQTALSTVVTASAEVVPEEKYSPFLMSIADEYPETLAAVEPLLVTAALAQRRRDWMCTLPPCSSRLRAAVHELAALHYRLRSESVGRGADRHVIVTHLPQQSRLPPQPLSAAWARQRAAQQQHAQSASRRQLVVSAVAAQKVDPDVPIVESLATARETNHKLRRLWHRALQPHAGYFEVIACTLSGGEIVQFSTPERCHAALLTLHMQAHRGVQVSRPP
ncbi:hypothetical protein CDCA_CDCA13G3682 [Cyanidium caldarium]|uniref:R3H domain-containing protein n=1 Tax=Cyanidium caldarium TaxID=2771 RepID=A0AAV9IZB4_CYACA|nr:hypothetical protein CDCA_CDCA13G3682 [Cyanidium caldarium]